MHGLGVTPQLGGFERPRNPNDLRGKQRLELAAVPRTAAPPGCCAAAWKDDPMFTPDDNLLALGSCIAGFGILMIGLLALLFRNPDAPRWTRPEMVAMLVCVPVTVATGFGLGYTAYGLSRLVDGTDPRELLVLAAVLIVLALAWRLLGIRRRLKDYAAATGAISASAYLATEPTLAIDEPPPCPKPDARCSGTAA